LLDGDVWASIGDVEDALVKVDGGDEIDVGSVCQYAERKMVVAVLES